ncbi:polysaccharide pyruvyl transferase family protein [Janibacter indicus]|uniref:Polysaccharide pyruvyl transferase family protein WcaK n=1 Tax=Janibacter indicus TaxID=857417 RepID=A0A1W1Y518_9MICO|nr:polysaccharide pyruvyl transferase family protein [Janibacter indicus]SMC31255.1 Polysaccharide pyruvyl transferase family protein WcaK [Janibacter indicus]
MIRNDWAVLSSANGSTNLGDESMWEATVQELRRLARPVHVTSDSHPSFTSPFSDVSLLPFLHQTLRRGTAALPHYLERLLSYPRRSSLAFELAEKLRTGPRDELSRTWFEELSNSAGVIFSGAGAITDDYAPHGIASWWLATEWAHSSGVPVHFLGQGIGPLVDERNRRYAARMLRLATTINVREEHSAEVVRGLGVDTTVSVTPDWAIVNRPETNDRAIASAQVDEWFGDTPFIALSLHRRHSTSRKYLENLSRLGQGLVDLARARGWGVAFIPNMTGSAYSDDRQTFDKLAAQWGAGSRQHVHVLRDQVGPRVTRALLAESAALFTTRYHPMIFALAEGTPTVGISFDAYYDQKLIGASGMFGVAGNVFRLENLTAEEAMAAAAYSPDVDVVALEEQNSAVLQRALATT